jgi:hypothetical protein
VPGRYLPVALEDFFFFTAERISNYYSAASLKVAMGE